ncbi:MAG TPA: PHP domain-containing protein [Clostridiales bacterium]|nr:PHP domain-containing protein [Clostridiales bacterium]
MYKLVIDYHTHTRYSHGKGSIQDNVEAARAKGLSKIAITDHGFNHIGFGMSISDIGKMRDEISYLNQKYSDIEILMGIEANLISVDGEIDIPEKYLDAFDIILMGFHKAVKPATLRDAWILFGRNGLDKLGIINHEKLRQANTSALTKALSRYPIQILTHPGAKIDIDSRALAKAAVKNNVALEINASHGFMTVEYVKIAMEEGANFVICSDAHSPGKVGDFEKGIQIARSAGVPPHRIINSYEYAEHI